MRFNNLTFEIKSVDKENYTLRGVFSTNDVDRHGEVVDQKGWILDEFLANPVVLFGHDHSIPAIGKVESIGYNNEGNLEGQIKFAVEEFDFARTIFNLYAGGYMRAFSAGFMNEEAEYDPVADILVLRKNTLYEVSCVNVPANAMALAKSKGIDTTPLEKLFTEGIVNKEAKIEKEGRALSSKTKELIVTARDALNTLLESDDKEDKSSETEAPDIGDIEKSKVEAPIAKGGSQKGKVIKKVNTALRSLAKAKKAINS